MMAATESYIVTEESDVRTVLPSLVDVLDQTRDNQPNLRRFEWLYLNNPDGQAVVWTLRKVDEDKIVGFTACIPRQMSVEGQNRSCWIGADFSILPKYRSLGLALKLRRAAKDQIDAGRVDFLYSHPNDKMAVIHERVGHRPLGKMIRLARLVTTRPILIENPKLRHIAPLAAPLLDRALAWAGPEWRVRDRGSVQVAEAAFDERFDELFARERRSIPIVGLRNAAYLNWRYVANPLRKHRVITLQRDGRLAAYLVFHVDEQESIAVVQDIFPTHEANDVRTLLKWLYGFSREEKLRSISMTLHEAGPLIALLKSFAYQTRAETSAMFHYAIENEANRGLSDPARWHVCQGDRDV